MRSPACSAWSSPVGNGDGLDPVCLDPELALAYVSSLRQISSSHSASSARASSSTACEVQKLDSTAHCADIDPSDAERETIPRRRRPREENSEGTDERVPVPPAAFQAPRTKGRS